MWYETVWATGWPNHTGELKNSLLQQSAFNTLYTRELKRFTHDGTSEKFHICPRTDYISFNASRIHEIKMTDRSIQSDVSDVYDRIIMLKLYSDEVCYKY